MAQINKPNQYFNTKLYTGTGSSNAQTGVGFQPDFTWIKKRNGAVGHRLYDAVRGATNTLYSDDSAAEATGQTNTLTSFNSDGFTVVSESGVNASSDTYASWNWLGANGTASNTDGSISSTVSANTTSGFSIVSYTGTGANATVGHGLGVTPKIVFFKRLDSSANWVVQTPLIGNEVQLVLNDTSAAATDSRLGASDNWSNQVFTVGTYGDMNASGGTYIAYCFNDVKGYSKFGSYTGNGNADGTFVYTGFKPAFFVVKPYSATGNWYCWDSKRSPINQIDGKYLELDASGAEVSTSGVVDLDFLSNGVKLRNTGAGFNGSGVSFIYMAFAENPLVGTNNIPATAR